MPDKHKYQSSEQIPLVRDANGLNLEIARWRCLHCEETWETPGGASGALFPMCSNGPNTGWVFIDAKPAS